MEFRKLRLEISVEIKYHVVIKQENPFRCRLIVFFHLFFKAVSLLPGGAAFLISIWNLPEPDLPEISASCHVYTSRPEQNQNKKISSRRSRSRAIRTYMLCVMRFQKAPGLPDFFSVLARTYMCFQKAGFPQNSAGKFCQDLQNHTREKSRN